MDARFRERVLALFERAEAAEHACASLRAELETARERLKLAAQDIEAAQARAAMLRQAVFRCVAQLGHRHAEDDDIADVMGSANAALAATEADVSAFLARVRAAALTDNAFVAGALEAKRLETIAVAAKAVSDAFEHDEDVAAVDVIRALATPAPAASEVKRP